MAAFAVHITHVYTFGHCYTVRHCDVSLTLSGENMRPTLIPRRLSFGCNGIMKALQSGRLSASHARPRRHRFCCEAVVKKTTRKRASTISKEDDAPTSSVSHVSNGSHQVDIRTWQPASDSGGGSTAVPDLHSGVPHGRQWEQMQRWLVFSDLHVTYKTLDVCRQVLRRVKAEAKAREAGILFLGAPHHLTCLPYSDLNMHALIRGRSSCCIGVLHALTCLSLHSKSNFEFAASGQVMMHRSQTLATEYKVSWC
jgi:hypothetical protein